MDEVEIRQIPGFPDYTISTDGRVFCSIKYGPGGASKPRMAVPREVKGSNSKGEVHVLLRSPDGTRVKCFVSRLILMAFTGPPADGWDAFHKDDNKLNNRLSNLEWRKKYNLPDVPIKPIPGYPGYCASEDGRIWTYWRSGLKTPVDTPVELAGTVNSRWGYKTVVLCCRDGKRKPKRVNRLILETFVGPCPPGMESAHWDNDRLNNNLSNLRWATHQENIDDKERCGTHQIGSRHNHATLHEDDVTAIRQRHARGESIRSLADEYGKKYFHMHAIVRRRCWKHIP